MTGQQTTSENGGDVRSNQLLIGCGEMPDEVAKKSNGEVKDEYEEAIRKLGLE